MTRTIIHLSSQPYHLPLKSALSWGKGHRLDALNHVLLRVELSDGAVGIAEAPPRPTIYGETPESIAAIIAQDCSDLLLGQPVELLADIQAAQQRLSLDQGQQHSQRRARYGAAYGFWACQRTVIDLAAQRDP